MKNQTQEVQEQAKSGKLKLNTESIVKISDADADALVGGSTCNSFTCTLCLSGGSK